MFAIPIERIKSIHLTYDEDGCATFYFAAPGYSFRTKDLFTRKSRSYPTFEIIADYHELEQFLREKIKGNEVRPVPYQEAVVGARTVAVTQWIFTLAAFYGCLLLFDFYLLPEQIHEDKILLMARNEHEVEVDGRFTSGTTTVDLGGSYRTEKGFYFRTDAYFGFEADRRDISITVSPIFKMVKGISDYRMDYTSRLDSTFTSFGKYAYWAAQTPVAFFRFPVSACRANGAVCLLPSGLFVWVYGFPLVVRLAGDIADK